MKNLLQMLQWLKGVKTQQSQQHQQSSSSSQSLSSINETQKFSWKSEKTQQIYPCQLSGTWSNDIFLTCYRSEMKKKNENIEKKEQKQTCYRSEMKKKRTKI